MIGQTLSHYQILAKLGEGGMGVVYKAQDLTLDRIVALKFLPAHATVTDEAKSRFMQEARSAAALNHPNICTVYGLEEHDGSLFIAMEYVDGGTLHSKLPLPSVSEALGTAMQIAEAVQEAHAKGIVHRDIKSDNVMLTSRGQAKVMDFGLAKLKGSLKLTKSSSTVGTLAYMAPEQIQGGAVDARSDIFSFGVLLFEMLTGRYPFPGEHQAAMMYSILNQEPTPLEQVLPQAPTALGHIIAKTLEKDPALRYQSMSDCIVDLARARRDTTKVPHPPTERIERPTTPRNGPKVRAEVRFNRRTVAGAGAGIVLLAALLLFHPWTLFKGSERKTLAVLPFENQAGPEREYFADGITEEITTRLSTLSGLGVVARTSAREYKKSPKPVRAIGTELNADYILSGTVRWLESASAAPRIRVTTDLVRISDGIQVWSQASEASTSDVFGLQSMIASQVAEALDVKLLQTERKTLTGRWTENAQAYDLYYRALEVYRRTSENRDHIEESLDLLRQALSLDPAFAAAHALVATEHSDMYWFFYDRSEDRIDRARTSADRALSLAPDLAEAHGAKGWFYYHCLLDYQSALEEFNAALRLQPNNANVIYGVAAVRRRQGDMEGSIRSWQAAIEQSPREEPLIRQYGETLLLSRRYPEASAAFARAWMVDSSDLDLSIYHAKCLLFGTGDIANARKFIAAGLRQPTVFRREELKLYGAFLDLCDGQTDAAAKVYDGISPHWTSESQFEYTPYPLARGMFERVRGHADAAHTQFESARVILEELVRKRPDDERYHSALGLAYAGLGREADALREGERGLALLPPEKEAWRGSYRLADLAQVHLLLGHTDKAAELIRRLLTIPGENSSRLFQISPFWKELKGRV